MVMGLLAVMVVAGGVSAFVFRNVFSCLSILVGFAVSIAMIFINPMLAATGNVPLMFAGAAVFGASVGFDICGFALAVAKRYDLEPKDAYEAVGVGLVVCGIATAAAAVIGMMSGLNLQGLQIVMFGGLFLVLGLGVVALFVRFNKVTEMIISFVLAIFWTVYLVIDFNMIAVDKTASWPRAMGIAMKLYLDLINLLLQVIKIYLMTKKH